MKEINFISAEKQNEYDIVEVKQWQDRKTGMTVIEHIPLKNGKITRYGKAHVPIPGMAPIAFQFIFPDEYELTDCFKNFEKYAEQALDQMQKEANQQIVIPKGMDSSSLKV